MVLQVCVTEGWHVCRFASCSSADRSRNLPIANATMTLKSGLVHIRGRYYEALRLTKAGFSD